MNKYKYQVPESKRVRMIVYTDCANEADDLFALSHTLMTPMCEVVGIIAAHFQESTRFPGFKLASGTTATASMDLIKVLLDKMELTGKYKLALGSEYPLQDEKTPIASEAAQMIIDEAMKEDDRPLYIGCQGSITDLASAIMLRPEICERMTAIWIGGGDYPEGGNEFNLMQDVNAANVVFSSDMPLWQVTAKVYKSFAVSLAELQYKVEPCGAPGKFMFDYMVDFNNEMHYFREWPHGEIWGLGDQGVMAALLQEVQKTDNYHMVHAPKISREDMHYMHQENTREIRVYDWMDVRITLEDFFAKLAINYG